jgi:hypothetical protein
MEIIGTERGYTDNRTYYCQYYKIPGFKMSQCFSIVMQAALVHASTDYSNSIALVAGRYARSLVT